MLKDVFYLSSLGGGTFLALGLLKRNYTYIILNVLIHYITLFKCKCPRGPLIGE